MYGLCSKSRAHEIFYGLPFASEVLTYNIGEGQVSGCTDYVDCRVKSVGGVIARMVGSRR